jgi:hypothetical protein
MTRRSTLRASDSDREQIAERLRHATAEGRLLAEELEERLTRALRARTYGELDELVSDLPNGRVVKREHSGVMYWVPRAFALALVAAALLAVLLLALFIITSVLAIWLFWAAIGWWLFGHRRCQGGRRRQVYRGGGERYYPPRPRHRTTP